jgi:hypothetical protein
MTWKDIVFWSLVIAGILLFLYGANTYDAVTGWSGIGLAACGLAAYIILKVHGNMTKKKD